MSAPELKAVGEGWQIPLRYASGYGDKGPPQRPERFGTILMHLTPGYDTPERYG